MSHVTTGQCLCGRIKLEATGAPLWVAHCHCFSCRSSTGAPVTTFVGFNRGQVVFQGERKFYPSSPGVRRGFCDTCGTPLTYESDRWSNEVHIYISVMDDPDAFTPERHVFYDERIAWLELNDDLPRYTGGGRTAPVSWGPKRSADDGG